MEQVALVSDAKALLLAVLANQPMPFVHDARYVGELPDTNELEQDLGGTHVLLTKSPNSEEYDQPVVAVLLPMRGRVAEAVEAPLSMFGLLGEATQEEYDTALPEVDVDKLLP